MKRKSAYGVAVKWTSEPVTADDPAGDPVPEEQAVTADDLGVEEPPQSHDAQSDLEWLSTGVDLKSVTAELAAPYVRGAIDPEDVVPIKLVVCGSAVDRDGERFSLEVLEDFAATLPGKSLLVGHDWSGLGVGRMVAAALRDQPDGETQLVGLGYMVRGTGQDDLIRLIEGGVVWACSIGFFAPDRQIGGDGVAVYTRGPSGEKAEAIEVSLVFLGSQYGAEVTKTFKSAKRCDRCGALDASCALDAHFVELELEGVTALLKRKRQHPPLVTESFAELHTKRARLERELEPPA